MSRSFYDTRMNLLHAFVNKTKPLCPPENIAIWNNKNDCKDQ